MAFPSSSKLVLTIALLSIAAFGYMPSAKAQVPGVNSTVVVVGRAICPLLNSLLGTIASSVVPIAKAPVQLTCGVGSTASSTVVLSTVTNAVGDIGFVLSAAQASSLNLDTCRLRVTVPASICSIPIVNGVLNLAMRMVTVTEDQMLGSVGIVSATTF